MQNRLPFNVNLALSQGRHLFLDALLLFTVDEDWWFYIDTGDAGALRPFEAFDRSNPFPLSKKGFRGADLLVGIVHTPQGVAIGSQV